MRGEGLRLINFSYLSFPPEKYGKGEVRGNSNKVCINSDFLGAFLCEI